MSKHVRPSRLAIALATLRAALFYFFVRALAFIMIGTLAVDAGIRVGWLEAFRVGNVEIPKFMGAQATNASVAILCGVVIIALAGAYLVRYLQTRPVLAVARARGVTDIDGDGRTDVFTDGFLDDV
jgi:hypothetical protein